MSGKADDIDAAVKAKTITARLNDWGCESLCFLLVVFPFASFPPSSSTPPDLFPFSTEVCLDAKGKVWA